MSKFLTDIQRAEDLNWESARNQGIVFHSRMDLYNSIRVELTEEVTVADILLAQGEFMGWWMREVYPYLNGHGGLDNLTWYIENEHKIKFGVQSV